MNVERYLRLIAGLFVMASLALGYWVHPGWFLFTGLVALAYTFFVVWRPVTWAIWLEFLPLYLFLAVPAAGNVIARVRSRNLALERRNIVERDA